MDTHDKIQKDELDFMKMKPVDKSRFMLTVGDIPAYLLHSISELHCNIDESGVKEWDDVAITMYDTVDLPTAKIIMDEVAKGQQYIKLTLLSPSGEVASTYELKKAHIYDVDLGSFNWDSVKPNTITILVEFDDLILQ